MNRTLNQISVAVLLTAVAAVGCTKERASEDGRQTAMEQTKQSPKPAPKPRTETFVIPSGTSVVAVLETALSTDRNQTGDHFQARTADAIYVDGKQVVPVGATIHGVLRDVQGSGKIKNRARMTLDFTQIEDSRGVAHSISAQPLTLQGTSETRGDVEKIAAGGVLGAIVGGIAGGKKGAAIGAGAGAGVGTVIVLATKGTDVELEPGRRMNVTMLSPTSIQLLAQR